jgi:uncharacterized OsmC-like protein
MSDQDIVNTVRSSSSGILGRSLNQIGRHQLAIDSPQLAEEITSGEAFLAGISSCGVNLVERVARETDTPLSHLHVTIEGRRARQRASDFAQISLHFLLTGPTQAQADELVGRYKDG